MMGPDRRFRALVLACVALAALAVPACGGDEAEPAAVADYGGMNADQVMFNLRQWLTTNGVRRAELTADTGFVFPDSSVVELRGVHLVMYDEAGLRTGELTSREGTVNTRTESMVARGNVVVITVEGGRRIETEELHYDPASDRIWSDVRTRIIEDGTSLTGTSFTANSSFQNVRLEGGTGRTEDVRLRF
ncbi:MAG: LPS export ABC transporter periplasmic protein LptC [Longimicrobiales bacterium]